MNGPRPSLSPGLHFDAAATPTLALQLYPCFSRGRDTHAAQVVLVALPGVDIDAVEEQVQRQCDALPRAEAARSALSHSCIVRVGGREEARLAPSLLQRRNVLPAQHARSSTFHAVNQHNSGSRSKLS